MDYINKVELQGFVGKVTNALSFVDFSLCTSEIYNNVSDSIVETTWHHVKVLGPCNIPKKGNFVHVIGRIKTSKYCDIDGKEHYEFYILANRVDILKEN